MKSRPYLHREAGNWQSALTKVVQEGRFKGIAAISDLLILENNFFDVEESMKFDKNEILALDRN